MIENRFPTIVANWAHFEKVDIAPGAPQIQRDEMQRAFMAGASSGIILSLIAIESSNATVELKKLHAELATWKALRDMKARGRNAA